MSATFPRVALMLGNFVTGLAIVGIAGMLPNLASGLGVTIQQAGLLVTAGAVVLCLGSPLTMWATNTVDRRILLGGSLLCVALGHFAAAFAPNYAALLVLRVVSGLALLSIFMGFTLWSLGAGAVVVMGAGVALWGLGFAAIRAWLRGIDLRRRQRRARDHPRGGVAA
jgi:MFS transporter, DHA1 family, inner membrane transport protein